MCRFDPQRVCRPSKGEGHTYPSGLVHVHCRRRSRFLARSLLRLSFSCSPQCRGPSARRRQCLWQGSVVLVLRRVRAVMPNSQMQARTSRIMRFPQPHDPGGYPCLPNPSSPIPTAWPTSPTDHRQFPDAEARTCWLPRRRPMMALSHRAPRSRPGTDRLGVWCVITGPGRLPPPCR